MFSKQTSFVALHKNRSTVVPINLYVTKISGIGEDMLFMGYLEVRPRLTRT